MPFKFGKNTGEIIAALSVLILVVLPIVLLIIHYASSGFLPEELLMLIWLWDAVLFLIALRVLVARL